MDNFYTFPQLLTTETHATGKMASNCKGFPEQIKELPKQYSSKPRGSRIYIRDNEVVYKVWKDTKCISVGILKQHLSVTGKRQPYSHCYT